MRGRGAIPTFLRTLTHQCRVRMIVLVCLYSLAWGVRDFQRRIRFLVVLTMESVGSSPLAEARLENPLKVGSLP